MIFFFVVVNSEQLFSGIWLIIKKQFVQFMNMYIMYQFLLGVRQQFFIGGRWQFFRFMKKYVYLMVCFCKIVIYNKFFIFQVLILEDNNFVIFSEDKIFKVIMLNVFSQIIIKVSVCEKRGVFVIQLKFSILNIQFLNIVICLCDFEMFL